MSVGLGIISYNRVAFLAQALAAIKTHLVDSGVVDRVYVVDDGSTEPARTQHQELAAATPWAVFIGSATNRGVGNAKNIALQIMLANGHRWLFLSEDDVVVQSPMAVLGYLGAATASGLHHLAFHSCRPDESPIGALGASEDKGAPSVTLWPNSVGRWAVFSDLCLRRCGLMDERFFNAWEHVEHTMRLGEAGFTTRGMGQFADATDSERWIQEIHGSATPSIIAQRPDYRQNMLAGLQHWRSAHPETYRWVAHLFEPATPRVLAPPAAAQRSVATVGPAG